MSRIVRFLALVAGLVLVFPLLGAAGGIAAAGASTTASSPLAKVQIAPKVPTGAKSLGTVAAGTRVQGAVVLQPRDPAALQKFIAGVTNKKSPDYRHYLAPGAFGATFGPTSGTIAAVKQQLAAGGLTVTKVTSDGIIVHFSGVATKVDTTFHTALSRYKLADGSIGMATTKAVELPSSIASSVVAVIGLDNLVHAAPAGLMRAPKSKIGTYPAAVTHTFTHPAGAPSACATATTAAKLYGGLTDTQIAYAYGAFGLYTRGDFGKNQTIAVYELGPYSRAHTNAFDTCYYGTTKAIAMTVHLHTQTSTPSTLRIDGGQPTGMTVESSLDVQDVSGIAPTATINVYDAPNTTAGGLDEYAAIVNQDTAQIVTTSWGLCEQAVQLGEPGLQQAENLLFEQAAAQGQSIFSAAGDTGSNDCNSYRTTSPVTPVLSVDDPSSQPYVVAVGGTTITDATSPPQEHVWNDGALWGAGGGGISQTWPMPAWQQDALVPGISTTQARTIVTKAETFMTSGFCLETSNAGTTVTACRMVPDVSAQADEFTGAITMYTRTGATTLWFTIGGTSSATPIWASLLALVNDSQQTNPTATCGGGTRGSGHTGVGFVSPLLYAAAATATAYAASFTDITVGNNDPYGASKLFPATTGYDMASGLGSPMLTDTTGTKPGLAYALCALAAPVGTVPTRPSVTSITPPDATTTAGGTVTIHGTNFCTGSSSMVRGVTIGSFTLPTVTGVTCANDTIGATFPPSAKLVASNDTTDGAGAYQVTVTLSDGQTSRPSPGSRFTYVDASTTTPVPVVTSVYDYAGTVTGTNTVDVFGTGFTLLTSVSFGGVVSTTAQVSLTNPDEIVAKVPPATNATCVGTGTITTICQVTVVVTARGHHSSTDSATSCLGATGRIRTILPPYEGMLSFNPLGVITPTTMPKGVEAGPQPCEYDYIPTPTLTSVSTSRGPASLASETPTHPTLVTIKGRGFDLPGFVSISVGTSTLATTLATTVVSVTTTSIMFDAPAKTFSTIEATYPLTVRTVAGTATSTIDYAGVPIVNTVQLDTKLGFAAPDTGTTLLHLGGTGLADAFVVESVDVYQTFGVPFSVGTQYNFTKQTTTTITTTTVSQNPGVVAVLACTVTACSTMPTLTNSTAIHDVIALYPPGAPVVDSITPSTGPASGGTTITITGQNLGCATHVTIAGIPAGTATFGNALGLLDCGSTTTVTVKAPPSGTYPLTGKVVVYTLESTNTGTTPTSSATFTYTAPVGGGTGGPPSTTAPRPPKGSTTSVSATYGTSGTHQLSDSAVGVTVTAKGAGSITVAGFHTNPASSTPTGATGTYADVQIGSGSSFTSLAIKVCPSGKSNDLVWWNGSAWVPFSSVKADATGCLTATVTATTSPNLAQLTGTEIAAILAGPARIAGATADATAAAELETAYSAATATTHPTHCVGGTAKTTSAATRTVVLATDQHFQDALSSQYLASSLGTGTLLTPYGQLSTATIAALKLEGITNVDVVGGTLAVSTAVVAQLEKLPAYACGGSQALQSGGTVRHLVVTRIWGATAYDTAQKVVAAVSSSFLGTAAFPGAYGKYNDTTGTSSAAPSSGKLRTAIVANGQEFQDAEAASMMSYEDHFPILLTTPSALSTQAATELKSLTVGQVIVMGGPLAVSNAVVSSLEGMGVSVLRIAGQDATDTSAQLAAFELTGSTAGLGWTPAGGVTIARGNGYTDGLAGAVLQAHYGANPEPLLLTENPSTAGSALTAFLKGAGSATGVNGTKKRITTLHVLGGSLAITTALAAQMETDLGH